MTKKKQIEERNELLNIFSPSSLSLEEACILTDNIIEAGYHKQPEWISVEDRLPEKHVMVLCYYKFEPESPDVICENLYHGGGFWLSDGSKVTHWMTIPAPPTEKEN